MRRFDTQRKIHSENLTLGDGRAHKVTSRIQNTRNACLETYLKTLIKKLETERIKIEPQRLDRSNTPKSHALTYLHRAH
jgi:hypothetical protein